MTIQKNRILITIFSIAVISLILMMPIFVNAQMGDVDMMGSGDMGSMMMAENADGMMDHNNMGIVIAGRMLHAWVSLGAAVIIFFLALKFMTGGKLARPIMLIGFGALADAIIGLGMTPGEHMQLMWLGSLIFSASVVVGIIWMGKIFGMFQSNKPIQ